MCVCVNVHPEIASPGSYTERGMERDRDNKVIEIEIEIEVTSIILLILLSHYHNR